MRRLLDHFLELDGLVVVVVVVRQLADQAGGLQGGRRAGRRLQPLRRHYFDSRLSRGHDGRRRRHHWDAGGGERAQVDGGQRLNGGHRQPVDAVDLKRWKQNSRNEVNVDFMKSFY